MGWLRTMHPLEISLYAVRFLSCNAKPGGADVCRPSPCRQDVRSSCVSTSTASTPSRNGPRTQPSTPAGSTSWTAGCKRRRRRASKIRRRMSSSWGPPWRRWRVSAPAWWRWQVLALIPEDWPTVNALTDVVDNVKYLKDINYWRPMGVNWQRLKSSNIWANCRRWTMNTYPCVLKCIRLFENINRPMRSENSSKRDTKQVMRNPIMRMRNRASLCVTQVKETLFCGASNVVYDY